MANSVFIRKSRSDITWQWRMFRWEKKSHMCIYKQTAGHGVSGGVPATMGVIFLKKSEEIYTGRGGEDENTQRQTWLQWMTTVCASGLNLTMYVKLS